MNMTYLNGKQQQKQKHLQSVVENQKLKIDE
jgi:hypothetical protein